MFSSKFFPDIKPLFIIGVPRSGTTFLHQIVNSHPEIFITDELRWVSWLIEESKKLREGFKVHGGYYPFNHGQEFSKYLTSNSGTLIAPFYGQEANKLGKHKLQYWGDKYPNYNEVLREMISMFPRATYILIHRDLKDVICSVKDGHQWDVTKSAIYVCNIYKEYIEILTEAIEKKSLDKKQLINVNYLDLITDIEKETQKIFNSLGLTFPDECREQVIKLRNIQSHSIRNNLKNPLKFNLNKSVERWKKDLSEDEQAIVFAKISEISEVCQCEEKIFK